MDSNGVNNCAHSGHQFLLQRWQNFCNNYNKISSHIEDLNKDRLDLSRLVWVQGFGDVGGEVEEDIIKFFTGQESGVEGILSVERESSEVFIITFISSTTATSFLSQDINYKGKSLTCFLLSDLEKRMKLESRARNFRDETVYRESDMGKRLLLIVDTVQNLEKDDFLEMLTGEAKLEAGLEHVFRCEVDEGYSKSFSGLYILTFKDKLDVVNPELVKKKQLSYISLLKDYITCRSQIIKENPIHIKVLSQFPQPSASLVRVLHGNGPASEDQIRVIIELTGFSSKFIDIREYLIKLMKLEHADSVEKVTEPIWCAVEDSGNESATVRISLNLYDIKPVELVQTWNDKDIKIGGCNIKARIVSEQNKKLKRDTGKI